MARDKNEYAWLPQLCKANYCLDCSGLVQILHFSAWTVKASSGQHHATVASMCRRHEVRMLSFCRFPVPRSKCTQLLQITCHKELHHVLTRIIVIMHLVIQGRHAPEDSEKYGRQPTG